MGRNVSIQGDVDLGKDVQLTGNTKVAAGNPAERVTVPAERITIDERTKINNCQVAGDVSIEFDCDIKDSRIGTAARGAGADRAGGTSIGFSCEVDGADIGRSTLGEHSRAGKRSVIIDSTVENRVCVAEGAEVRNTSVGGGRFILAGPPGADGRPPTAEPTWTADIPSASAVRPGEQPYELEQHGDRMYRALSPMKIKGAPEGAGPSKDDIEWMQKENAPMIDGSLQSAYGELKAGDHAHPGHGFDRSVREAEEPAEDQDRRADGADDAGGERQTGAAPEGEQPEGAEHDDPIPHNAFRVVRAAERDGFKPSETRPGAAGRGKYTAPDKSTMAVGGGGSADCRQRGAKMPAGGRPPASPARVEPAVARP